MTEPPVRALPDGSDVRKLSSGDLPRVIGAVARGFYDDPMMRWLFPGDERRLARLEAMFGLYARRIWLQHDESYTTDRLIGGCFWLPPGTWHLSPLAQLRLAPASVAALRGSIVRGARFLTKMEAAHPREPHYYLPVIGIDPEWHGRGFGAALLKPVLDRCHRDGLPAYLEASSPRSRALYERNGFEVTGELTVAGSPPAWTMWREPHRLVTGG